MIDRCKFYAHLLGSSWLEGPLDPAFLYRLVSTTKNMIPANAPNSAIPMNENAYRRQN